MEITRAEMILLIMLGEPLEKKILGGFVPTGFESGAFKPECRGHRQGPATEDRANPRKLKMTVRGTMVRSEVCNSWCFCLVS